MWNYSEPSFIAGVTFQKVPAKDEIRQVVSFIYCSYYTVLNYIVQ